MNPTVKIDSAFFVCLVFSFFSLLPILKFAIKEIKKIIFAKERSRRGCAVFSFYFCFSLSLNAIFFLFFFILFLDNALQIFRSDGTFSFVLFFIILFFDFRTHSFFYALTSLFSFPSLRLSAYICIFVGCRGEENGN